MPTVERDRWRFDVSCTGPEDGEAVLLLHGFPQGADVWARVAAALAGEGYRAIAPDQRGYSPGARPTGAGAYRVRELVADALAVVDALVEPGARAHVVGHDLGALVAWSLAARHPDRVRTLTAVSVPPAASLSAGALHCALNWYRGMLAGSAGTPEPPVRVPAQLVWSSGEGPVTRPAAELAHRYVAGPFRYVELCGVSHWIPDEAPETLAELVIEHMAAYRG